MTIWGETDILLIVNPRAGGRRGERSVAKVIRAARAAIPRLDVLFTERPGDARTFAARAGSEGIGAVLCAGGDGTIHEVVNGLAASPLPLGILPMGTANVLAREIGLPPDAERAVAALLKGSIRRIALGKAADRRFILMAGVGFDADVIGRVDDGIKRLSGTLAYGIAGVQALFRYPYPELSVRIDGKQSEATSVIVSRARRYAGDFVIAPEASLGSPVFHVRIFSGRGAGIYTRHVVNVLLGCAGHALESSTVVCDRVEVSAEGPVPIQADGELIGTTPVTFTIEREALELIFPATAGRGASCQ